MTKTTYTIRRPGCAAWLEGVPAEQAEAELRRANDVAPGHRLIPDGEGAIRPFATFTDAELRILWDRLDATVAGRRRDGRILLAPEPAIQHGPAVLELFALAQRELDLRKEGATR